MDSSSRKSLAARNILTARTAALRIQEELDLGDPVFALRLLGNTATVLLELDPQAGELEEFLAEPLTIREHRWDVLLRTVIRWRMLELGYTPPAWTNAPALNEPWFMWEIPLGDGSDVLDEEWKDRIRVRTPVEFSARNLWCDAARDFSTA
jgi:hypothetical protein